MSRIVAVSNRVAAPEARAPGGLAAGVLSALQDEGGMWFGWNGKITDDGAHDPELVEKGKITYATIDLNREDFEKYYNGFSNNTLWPLFHSLLGFFSYDRTEYECYLGINRLFARKLLPLLQPDDLIWVHDYHLIPLAFELRKLGVRQPIGFFLHTPFPNLDVLRALPSHIELLKALCAYDVAGFQTDRDLRAFQECVSQRELQAYPLADRRMNVQGWVLWADVFPIGIDVEDCVRTAETAQMSIDIRRTVASLDHRSLIIGVDRLDYSKGLPERFRAYEKLLEGYPENRGGVTYMQIAPPTRVGVRAYNEIRQELEQAAGHLNGRFAEMHWVPIRYLNRNVDRQTLMGLMRTAAVGLVTPIRDGMNLVAKEFVGSQDPTDPGVLVLSKLAGAARELEDAVLVNPYDIYGVAEGLQRALHMPLEERRERYESMMTVLRHNDIHSWRRRFIDALSSAPSGEQRMVAEK